MGEDGPAALPPASLAALDAAEAVIGAPRLLELAGIGARGRPWPVPFSLAPVLARRGRPTAMLASGDPFWHGAGGSVARQLGPGEWRAFPAPSTFALVAARLGWPLEGVRCLGLHAAPAARARPVLAPGARLICLMRDGAAVTGVAGWLAGAGFGASRLHVMEALGGPRERVRTVRADAPGLADIAAPVAVAVEVAGGPALASVPGREAALFAHDGQISKGPMRALTLAALAPVAGARLWDVGAGSGAVSVEWALAGGCALAVEARADRAANIAENAARFGVDDRIEVIEGRAPGALSGLAAPDAAFLGGGASEATLEALRAALPAGARLVANAVTVETEALLARWHGAHGGQLTRIALAEAEALGSGRGWAPARPVTQWQVTR